VARAARAARAWGFPRLAHEFDQLILRSDFLCWRRVLNVEGLMIVYCSILETTGQMAGSYGR
jgi:hypothetical protein